MRRRTLLAVPLAVAALPARAQAPFPDRPLTLVVPFGAGSSTDLTGRMIAQAASAVLGQPVAVENRAGAGGTIGVAQVVRSRADGHTLAFVSSSTIPINRALYRNLGYDPQRDLVPVSLSAKTPNALVVPGSSPWRTMAEFVAAGRDPARTPLRYFSSGNGTTQHLAGVQVVNATGIRAEHIPYRGPAEGLTALLAGEIEWGVSAVPVAVPQVREGRLRVLGVTGAERAPPLPDVPTFESLGMRGFAETDVWYGVAAPRGTPDPVLARLREAFRQALAQPDLQQRLTAAGLYPMPAMDGAAMQAFLDRQVAFWAELVKASGATID